MECGNGVNRREDSIDGGSADDLYIHARLRFIRRLDGQCFVGLAELPNRLFARRSTPVGHRGAGGVEERHQAGMSVEAQHKEERDKRSGDHRSKALETNSHALSLSPRSTPVNGAPLIDDHSVG